MLHDVDPCPGMKAAQLYKCYLVPYMQLKYIGYRTGVTQRDIQPDRNNCELLHGLLPS
jgi:hypothetical protein